jgi:hypothetical protein
MRRRQILTATAIGISGLAGCAGGSNSGDTGSEESPAKATVKTFYTTLYGEDDLEATNAMYHPDSEVPALKPANFEHYGGLESMSADVNSTEIIEQSDGVAEVHAVIRYSTPVGSATNTDWFVLSKADGEWLVALFLPESARGGMSEEEIEGAMETAKAV